MKRKQFKNVDKIVKNTIITLLINFMTLKYIIRSMTPVRICQTQIVPGKKIMKFIIKLGFGCAAISWKVFEPPVTCSSRLTLPHSLLGSSFCQKTHNEKENVVKYLPNTVYTDRENYDACYKREVDI
jgi:hypothetical protein